MGAEEARAELLRLGRGVPLEAWERWHAATPEDKTGGKAKAEREGYGITDALLWAAVGAEPRAITTDEWRARFRAAMPEWGPGGELTRRHPRPGAVPHRGGATRGCPARGPSGPRK